MTYLIIVSKPHINTYIFESDILIKRKKNIQISSAFWREWNKNKYFLASTESPQLPHNENHTEDTKPQKKKIISHCNKQ